MPEICPSVRVESLLVATDGSQYSEGAVREAIRLAKRCSSSLVAVTVVETNPEYQTIAPHLFEKAEKIALRNLEAVKELAKKEGLLCDGMLLEGEDSYRVIVDEAAKRKSSMIIMGRRGRTGLARLMMGSVTARVIGHAPCNVLVVPRSAQVEFKNIVVAVDGSRYSDAAAGEAIGIAKRCGSNLTIVSVVPSEFASAMDIVQSQMPKGLVAENELIQAEKNVQRVKEAAEKEGVRVSGIVLAGRPADAVVQTAKDKKADLIVLGSHGKTGVEKLLMGSVTERVIVLSDCAVLVVKTA